MNFSQRIGLEPQEIPIQKNSVNQELRNSLWNILQPLYSQWIKYEMGYSFWDQNGIILFRNYWRDFLKLPIDEIPDDANKSVSIIRKLFFQYPWNKVYDFIEFTYHQLRNHEAEKFKKNCNFMLERENAAYRFIGNYIAEIVSDEEIQSIETSLNHLSPYKAATTHINSALQKLSNRDNPDYRNSRRC